MDRMTPPPNYYGAPFPGFNQGGQQSPQPTPNGNMTNQMNNNPMPQPQAHNYNSQFSTPPVEIEKPDNTIDSICLEYSLADMTEANRGKYARVYCAFPDSTKWHDVIIEGKIYYAAYDHIVIETESEPNKYIFVSEVFISYIELLSKPNMPTKKST